MILLKQKSGFISPLFQTLWCLPSLTVEAEALTITYKALYDLAPNCCLSILICYHSPITASVAAAVASSLFHDYGDPAPASEPLHLLCSAWNVIP